MSKMIRSPKPWRKWLFGSALCIAALSSLGAFAYLRTDLPAATKQYDKVHSEAEKLGFVMSQAEYDRWFQANDNDNAGVDFVRYLQSSLPTLDELERISFKKHFVCRLEPSKYIDDWLLGQQSLFQILESFPARFRDPISHREIPLSQKMRLWKIEVRLARLALDQRTLIGAMLSFRTTDSVCYSLLDNFHELSGSAGGRTYLQEISKDLDFEIDFKSILAMEHWFALSQVTNSFLNPMGMKRMNSTMEGTIVRKGFESLPFEIRLCNLIPNFKRASDSRVHEVFVKSYQGLPKDLSDLTAVENALLPLSSFPQSQLSYTFLGERKFVPHVLNVYKNLFFQALEAIKPGCDLTKGLPRKDKYRLDLDGKDLRLVQTGSGWNLYSIGSDLKDDGGNTEASWSLPDVVIHLPKK